MLNQYRTNITVDSKHREPIFQRKYLTEVVQTATLRLNEPTEEELRNDLNYVEKIFSIGDKMYKYAHEVYGSTEYWWVIAWFNNKPTEHLLKAGDTIKIPISLSDALQVVE